MAATTPLASLLGFADLEPCVHALGASARRVRAWRLPRPAAELEQALREAAAEALTLTEAAAESGYSERRLRELLADGSIPQAGRRGAPRIRRADLPPRARAGGAGGGYDASADAAALLGRR